MAILGDFDYHALITNRGGGSILAEIPINSLSYGRTLDEMSEAGLTTSAQQLEAFSDNTTQVLSELNPWQHELSIWRDSSTTTPDWVGPIGLVSHGFDFVSIQARDLFWWLERRFLHDDYDPIEDDLARIFETFVIDALSTDTSPNITVTLQGPAGVTGERRVLSSEYRRAADELRELARSGVDFTMRGRELLISGEELFVDPILVLSTHLVENAELVIDGVDAATRVVVKGSPGGAGSVSTFGSNSEQLVGDEGGFDPDFGLLESSFSELQIRDTPSAAQAAASRLSMLSPPPRSLVCDLLPEIPIAFSDLLPGGQVDAFLKLAARDVAETFRLQNIAVQLSAGEEGATETVTATLIPVGTLQ